MELNIAQTDPLKRSLQAIGMIVFVVLFNLGLWLILMLVGQRLIQSDSSFPAFVLFLSFALSVGIILIVGLGEKIDTKNIKNEWIKKIGVTPIMVIVAVLISVLAGFTGLAKKIIPLDNDLKLKFMLANIGITCAAKNPNKSPEASNLLAVISSPDERYIEQIESFLVDKSLLSKAKNSKFEVIKGGTDAKRGPDAEELYKTLIRFANSNEKGSDSLLDDLATDSRWVAYSVKMNDAASTTSIPIPAVFDENHKTRLFVTFPERFPTDKRPEVASLDASVAEAPRPEILPLVQVNIAPNRPQDLSQVTNLDVKIFTGHSCWTRRFDLHERPKFRGNDAAAS